MRKLEGPAFLFLAFTLAGTSVVSARLVSKQLGAFTVAAVSLLFALAVLLPFCAGSFGALRRLSPRGWLSLVLQALFGIFLFRLLLLWGLMRTSAGEAGILTGATPAATALFAVLFLREKLSAARLAGIVSTVAGILLLQGLFSGGLPSARHIVGNLLVLCAAVSEAVFNTLSRRFAVAPKEADEQPDPAAQTAAVIALALLLSLVPALFERPFRSLADVEPAAWLALIWYGVAVTAVGYFFWYGGIRRSGGITAAAFSGMMPLTSVLLSAAVLGERAGWALWAGGALVTAGMLMTGVPASVGGRQSLKTAIHERRQSCDEPS